MQVTFIEPRESYLFASGGGEFDPTQALTLLKSVVEQCVRHKRSKLLIDFTSVEGELSILVLYDMGIKTAQCAADLSHLALIDRPERILPDRFWENVTRNYGLNARVFGSFAEGEAWLVGCASRVVSA
jgi:hypothetical protein